MHNKSYYFYLFFAVVCISAATTTHADHFDNTKRKIIIFGDSFADIGNLPPILFLTPTNTPGLVIPPPSRYDRGRFTNGPNVVDYLARKLRVHIKPSNIGFDASDNVSFAHGGSTTYMNNITPGGFPVPGLLGQVTQFLNSETDIHIHPQTIIMILSGSNDYMLGAIQPEGIPPINPSTTVQNLRTSINQLYDRGARQFVVFNLPDLGKTPICTSFNICSLLSNLTIEHNALLTDTIRDLKRDNSDLAIAKVNLYSLYERIVESPENYGFVGNWQNSGSASGCLFQDPLLFDPIKCNLLSTFNTKFIFWDELHPTTNAHKLIAKRAWRSIKRNLF